MMRRTAVCGWCPVHLPDDPMEWASHFLAEHHIVGHSVRFYPAISFEDEVAAITRDAAERPL